MVIAKNSVRCKLEVEGAIIDLVLKFFHYLGIDIIGNRDLINEAKNQSTESSRIFNIHHMEEYVGYMTTEGKLRVYKTMVRPILK